MSNTICIIYNYLTLKRKKQAYYIIGFFSEGGELKQDLLYKYYNEMFYMASDSEYLGPFQSFNDILKYSMALCNCLDTQKAQILSVEEYNLMMENVTNTNEFAEQILLFGESFINSSYKKKKRFFRELFR